MNLDYDMAWFGNTSSTHHFTTKCILLFDNIKSNKTKFRGNTNQIFGMQVRRYYGQKTINRSLMKDSFLRKGLWIGKK